MNTLNNQALFPFPGEMAVGAAVFLSEIIGFGAMKTYPHFAAATQFGPMPQDFRAAFGLGTDERNIATVDADGVALAAIQGLNQKLENRSQKLEAENMELKKQLAELKALVESLAEKVNRGAK